MLRTPYRLPDGRIVDIDEDIARGATVIDFTLEGGRIVQAVRVRVICADCGRPTSDQHECQEQRAANRRAARRARGNR